MSGKTQAELVNNCKTRVLNLFRGVVALLIMHCARNVHVGFVCFAYTTLSAERASECISPMSHVIYRHI